MPVFPLRLALGLGLAGLGGLIYWQNRPIDFAEHRQFEKSMLEIRAHDTALNQDVLKARFRLLNDYDGFADKASEIQQDLTALRAIPAFVGQDGRRALQRDTEDLAGLLATKLELIERFKSQNAVFNNSLAYFPGASGDLLARLASGAESKDLEWLLNQLTREVLVFSLSAREESPPDVQATLRGLAEWRRAHPEHPDRLLVASLTTHAAAILQRKPTLEGVTREILALPTAKESDELLRSYHVEVAARLSLGSFYRLTLFIVSTALALGIGYTIYALWKAKARLEQRVRERTSALSGKNDELQCEIVERLRTEGALKTSELRFREIAETIQDVFWITSADLREIHYVSQAFETVWGRPAEALYERPLLWSDSIFADDKEAVFKAFAQLSSEQTTVSVEFRIHTATGEVRWIADRGFLVLDADGQPCRIVGVARDVTERKRLEAELIEASKLQTVGRLAGGIAHDFNTILTAIIGHAELIGEAAPPGSDLLRSAGLIGESANRAAKLTQQLLAFSRKQLFQPVLIDLNELVAEAGPMLRRLVGEAIDVRCLANAEHAWTKADANQLQQVIVQLAMNARDAMPGGGSLTLETADRSLDESYAAHHAEVVAGEYVVLAVSDTGGGISEDVKSHLFEPFFTTKAQGEGTGLGLAMCYGVVKQIGGHLTVESETGRGTTFKIYLPRLSAAPLAPPLPSVSAVSPPPAQGKETILLVEDDANLRELATIVLEKLSYTVHPAANGLEAIRIAEEMGGIDLLLTDLNMPQMDGKELAAHFSSSFPSVKVLFTSAYTREAMVHHRILDPEVEFLQKPYTPLALTTQTRRSLDGKIRGGMPKDQAVLQEA